MKGEAGTTLTEIGQSWVGFCRRLYLYCSHNPKTEYLITFYPSVSCRRPKQSTPGYVDKGEKRAEGRTRPSAMSHRRQKSSAPGHPHEQWPHPQQMLPSLTLHEATWEFLGFLVPRRLVRSGDAASSLLCQSLIPLQGQ